MSNPLYISPSPSLPVCHPGDDPLDALDQSSANATQTPQAERCEPGGDVASRLPPPEHPAGRASAAPSAPLPADEKQMLEFGGPQFLKTYQQNKASIADAKREVAEAHRSYEATGQIPRTRQPFAWIEIKQGRLMSRAERYDAMLASQGKDHPSLADVQSDQRNPEYLAAQEFKDEFKARHAAEWQQCDDDHWFRGPTYRCQEGVDEKYGGEEYKAYDKAQCQDKLRQYEAVGDRIDGVKNGGPVSLGGRVVGRATGYLIDGDKGAEVGDQIGAMVGSIGDVGVAMKAGMDGRARVAGYKGSAGLEVRRDAPVVEVTTPSSSGKQADAKVGTNAAPARGANTAPTGTANVSTNGYKIDPGTEGMLRAMGLDPAKVKVVANADDGMGSKFDVVINVERRPAAASSQTGEIAARHIPDRPVTQEPSVVVPGGIEALEFKGSDGVTRMMAVVDGATYYMSTGKSTSKDDAGTPSRKIKGEFYEARGVQQHPVPPQLAEHGVHVTWVIKGHGITNVDPVAALKAHTYFIQQPLCTDPAIANQWLRDHGANVVDDVMVLVRNYRE